MAAQPGNAINCNTTTPGLVNFDGTATFTTTGLVQYYTMVGASNRTVQNVAPGTSGWVLTSGGASAYPAYAALPFTKMPWTDEAISFNAVAQNGYFVTATATATLPAGNQGDMIAFEVDGVGSLLTIQAAGGQIIRIGKAVSAAAGTAVNNFQGDSVTLVYRASDTSWQGISVIGTFTVT